MDRSLDDVISERRAPAPRSRRGGGRYDDRRGVRDSYRKPQEDLRNPEEDHWVHDRYEGDRFTRRDTRPRTTARVDRYEPANDRVAETSTKLRVDNLHYDLTERDLRGLFNQQGPVLTLELVYDRAGRSTGQAYVTYESSRDAEIAIREYDGAKAMGQYIKVTRVPTGPSMKGRGFGARTEGLIGSSRSLFERVERRRSESPRRSDRLAPDGVDRYVPRDRPAPRRRSPRSRSPPRRGRGGRGGRGRGPPRTDGEGRALVGGRPRKSANDLDAEMEDYWGGNDGAADDAGPVDFGKVDPPETAAVAPPAAAPATAANGLDEDIDMIE